MSTDIEIQLRKSLAHAEARVLKLETALQNLIKPADGCVGVLWKSCDPRDGKFYADQTHKAISEARAVLKEHPDE